MRQSVLHCHKFIKPGHPNSSCGLGLTCFKGCFWPHWNFGTLEGLFSSKSFLVTIGRIPAEISWLRTGGQAPQKRGRKCCEPNTYSFSFSLQVKAEASSGLCWWGDITNIRLTRLAWHHHYRCGNLERRGAWEKEKNELQLETLNDEVHIDTCTSIEGIKEDYCMNDDSEYLEI